MSFTEAKREAIKKYMLDKIRNNDVEFVQKVMDNFGVSATTVKRYIKSCMEQKIIYEDRKVECGYRLYMEVKEWELENNGTLEEDTFYQENVVPVLQDISKNARDIWYYAFTEIMNNAIEHSGGSKVWCRIRKDALYTEISITDNGIGIFQNIRKYTKEQMGISIDNSQAMMELYKGKLTTCPTNHSGEGIFFTSKILSALAIWSQNTVYAYRCEDKDRFVQSHLISYYTKLQGIGTMAVMKLENDTKRTTREVFDVFAPMGDGFVKTLIPMKELCPLGDPVARSQARRIVRRLEEFKEVVFDFRDIEFMGQGFADEVFRVFQNQYPEVTLTVINANESVLGMIKHVKR